MCGFHSFQISFALHVFVENWTAVFSISKGKALFSQPFSTYHLRGPLRYVLKVEEVKGLHSRNVNDSFGFLSHGFLIYELNNRSTIYVY